MKKNICCNTFGCILFLLTIRWLILIPLTFKFELRVSQFTSWFVHHLWRRLWFSPSYLFQFHFVQIFSSVFLFYLYAIFICHRKLLSPLSVLFIYSTSYFFLTAFTFLIYNVTDPLSGYSSVMLKKLPKSKWMFQEQETISVCFPYILLSCWMLRSRLNEFPYHSHVTKAYPIVQYEEEIQSCCSQFQYRNHVTHFQIHLLCITEYSKAMPSYLIGLHLRIQFMYTDF